MLERCCVKKYKLLLDSILIILTLLILLLFCSGCGNTSQTEQEETGAKNNIQNYTVEWLHMEPTPSTQAGIFMEPVIAGGNVYYVNQNADTKQEKYTLYQRELGTDKSGNIPLKLAGQYTITDFDVDEEGNCYYCIHDISLLKENPDAKAKKLLIKQDAAGTEIYRVEIPTEHCGAMPSVNVDVQGKIYFTGSKDYVVYNNKGEYEGTIPWQPWEELAAVVAGEEYVPHGIVWENYDILTETVKSATTCEDGSLYVVVSNYEKECYEIAVFTPVSAGEVANQDGSEEAESNKTAFTGTAQIKTELSLGILTANAQIREAVVDFNKEQSDVRVFIKEYLPQGSALTEDEAIAAMYQDIQTGKGVDILAISPGMDWEKLAEAEILEDLYPYVERSDVIQENDYLRGAWEMYLHGGKLLALPTDFTIETLACKSDILQDKELLTVEELYLLADNYSDSQLLGNNAKEHIFNLCFIHRESAYVNEVSRTCNFATDDFYKTLEFVNQFPMNSEATVILDNDRFATGKVLFQEVELINVDSYLQVFEDFGMEEVTFIGYPALEVGQGHRLNPCGEMLGISALSSQKDVAWKFVEAYDNWNQERIKTVGFSAKREVLEKQIEDALKEWQEFADEQLISQFLFLSDSANLNYGWDSTIANIFMEECMSFLVGDKSAEEVAEIIQSRVSMYLAE